MTDSSYPPPAGQQIAPEDGDDEAFEAVLRGATPGLCILFPLPSQLRRRLCLMCPHCLRG